MADLKTAPTGASVTTFLDAVADPVQRADAKKLVKLMREVTGEKPAMWGPSIVGFGSYHYRYESGREGDMLLTGFSPRKGTLVLYIMSGFSKYDELMAKLGRHRTGKSCLYIKRLADVDEAVLRRLVKESVAAVRKREKEQLKR